MLSRLSSLLVLFAAALAVAIFPPPSASQATLAGSSDPDTPVLLNNRKAAEEDEGERILLERDDYFISRRIAGDVPLSVEEAGALRAGAARAAANLKQAPDSSPATFTGAWTGNGPNPIVQVSRQNHFYAVSGRIGALAMRSSPPYTIYLGAAQGGIWTYSSATNQWTPKTDNLPSLSIGALAIAPSNEDIIYAGTGEGHLSGDSYFGNGVLKSTDGGNTWNHVSGDFFRGVSISRIVVHPSDPNHLWAAVLRGRGGARRVTPPDPSTYGIWESTDGGVSWVLRKGTTNQFKGATDLEIDPQSPNVLYATFWSDAVYKSVDSGVHWAPIMNGLPSDADYSGVLTRFSLGISHPAGQAAVLYLGFDYVDTAGDYHPSRVWKSTDEGASWTLLPAGSGADSVEDYCGGQCFYDNVIEPDPNDTNIVYALGQFNYGIGSGGIFRSVDGGQTWVNLGYDQHPDFQAIAIRHDDAANVVIGSDGGVWFSSSRGGRLNAGDPLSAVTWQNLNGTVDPNTAAVTARTGLQISQFTSIANVPTVPARAWGGTQDNGTVRKSAVSQSWFDVASGDGGQVLVDPTNASFVFGTYFGITPYRFSDGGAFFFSNEFIDNGINGNDRAEFYVPWVMNKANPNQLFLGTYRLYRTDNAEAPQAGDVLWQPISPDLTTGCPGTAPNGGRGCFISAIGLAPGGSGVYTGSEEGLVYLSPDAVTSDTPSWQRVDKPPLPHRPVTQIAVDRSNYRIAYVAFAGFNKATPGQPGHLFRTLDGGKKWDNVSGNLPDAPVNSVILDPSFPNTLYVGTDVGPFVTYDGGASWSALGSGFPVVAIWQLDLDPANRNLRAGTHGRGAWTLNDSAFEIPALQLSISDPGVPIGPGSLLTYTLTLRNIGNAAATGVSISNPIPRGTSFVSASAGGALTPAGEVWSGLTVQAGGSVSVDFTVRIATTPRNQHRTIINDGAFATAAEGVATTASPHVNELAPPFGTSVTPDTQTDGTRAGESLTYALVVKNLGFNTDKFDLSVSGNTFPAEILDSTCASAMTQTPDVLPGDTVGVCARVSVPGGATNGQTDTATITATSVGDPSASDSASVTTIAVTAQILLVDDDDNAPDVKSYYQAALDATGQPYNFWDLAANASLPINYMKAHANIVWFTGASYPGPLLPFESRLAAFLDNGGRLFMSGDDILDQAAGTTAFVHDYLHIDWDGSEAQNDIATDNVKGEPGNAVTNGIGTVPLDTSVLGGVDFSDQLTLIAPATVAFRDDANEPDGLSLDTGSYKVVFLAFPFEEYGAAVDKGDLMNRVLTFFGP